MKLTQWVAFVNVAIAGGFFLESSYYWAAPYGPGVTIGQEGLSSLFSWIGIGLLCISGIFLFIRKPSTSILGTMRAILPIIPLAILAAVATGWLGIGGGVNPGGISAANYGFPFVWRIVQTSCPPPCIQANDTVYNPFFLALDSGFFSLLGYWLVTILKVRGRALAGQSI